MERLDFVMLIIGLAIGACGMALAFESWGLTIDHAQRAYTRCVTDGAPAENCARNYLLPKEGK